MPKKKSRSSQSIGSTSTISTRKSKKSRSSRSSRSTKSKRRRSKKVVFNEVAYVKNIPTVNDLTEEEVQSIWYNTQDLRTMRENYMKAIKRISTGSRWLESYDQEDEDMLYTDGLETLKNAEKRREIQKDALDAVLCEQEFQWDEHVRDPEYIADVYFEVTYDNQMDAYERGKQCFDDIYGGLHRSSKWEADSSSHKRASKDIAPTGNIRRMRGNGAPKMPKSSRSPVTEKPKLRIPKGYTRSRSDRSIVKSSSYEGPAQIVDECLKLVN